MAADTYRGTYTSATLPPARIETLRAFEDDTFRKVADRMPAEAVLSLPDDLRARLGSDDAPGLSVSLAGFMADFKPPEWQVDGLMQRGYLYAITAPTGHCKTAIATLVEQCVAGGTDFAGHATLAGRVLMLVGENPHDKQCRIIVTAAEHGFDAASPLVRVIARSFPLAEQLDAIRAECERFGDIALVTVDTAAAYFAGMDENDNAQARQYASDLRALTELPGRPTVLVLAHPTKNAGRENLLPRGGGAFLAEIDGNLTCWLDGDVATLHWQGKLRGPGFEPLQFRIKERALGIVDSKGRELKSVVAMPVSDREAEAIASDHWQQENRLLFEMRHDPSGSIADWARACGWVSEAGAPHKSKVKRTIDGLAADKFVRKVRGKWELTETGKREAEANK